MPDTESSTLSSIIDDYDNSLNDIRVNVAIKNGFINNYYVLNK